MINFRRKNDYIERGSSISVSRGIGSPGRFMSTVRGCLNARAGKALSILILICLALAVFAPFTPSAVSASSGVMSAEDKAKVERARKQMEDISKQAEGLVKEQRQLAAQQKTVLGEMKVLSNQISDLEKEIDALDWQIKYREEQIDILSEEIEIKTAEVNQRNEYFDTRLNRMYRDGEISVFDVLLSSASVTDFLTRFDLIQRVVENDVDLLQSLRQAKADLEAQKAALEDIKAGLEEEQNIRYDKAAELSDQKKEQSRKSAALAADIAMAIAAEDELNALSKTLEKFVADIQSKYKNAYMGSGTMGWPVPGRTTVTSAYGYRNHPILKVNRFHSGIDISAPSGTAAVSADTGKVIMAATYGGFGKTVILDHGGGVATQYSHLVSINVSEGQLVFKGEKVGGVGSTGLSTGNHLHFQIMINGGTVDPMNTSGKYFVNPK